jgi:PhzF family phenazine biosynthesis protein
VLRSLRYVDVFTDAPFGGNPVAVVLDGEGLDDDSMLRVARWTNLSETTFVLPPTQAGADYQVRILTPAGELPFAGHPTLGTCHAWLEAGGQPAQDDVVVQQCAAGLVQLQRNANRLAFAAPPLVRSGPVDPEIVSTALAAVDVPPSSLVEATWADNGPGWIAFLVDSVDAVRAARAGRLPAGYERVKIGLVAHHPTGARAAIEVRAFFPQDGILNEDPVTGSLNASVAQWLLGSARLTAPYVASQGAALGRSGEIHVSQDPDGTVWIGGGTRTLINGSIEI